MNMRTQIAMAALAMLTLSTITAAQPASPFAPSGVYGPTRVYVPSPPVQATVPEDPNPLEDGQLDELLAPIALYPDPLLAQILPAATYDSEIVQAARWLAAYPNLDENRLILQPWEPSVKALVHYPSVLAMMNDNLEWTQAIGAAFLAQQGGVTDAIQRLRRQAMASGALQTTAQQQVIIEDGMVQILPPSPQVLYVPSYDPRVVYIRQAAVPSRPLISFSIGHGIGAWLDNGFDWRHRWVHSGGGWQYGWRFDNQRWRRDDRPVLIMPTRSPYNRDPHDRPGELRPWSHNSIKPRPVLPPILINRRSYDDQRGWDDRRIVTPPPTGPRSPFSLPLPRDRGRIEIQPPHPPVRLPSGPFGPVQSQEEIRRALERAEQSRHRTINPQGLRVIVPPGPAGPRNSLLPADEDRLHSDRGHQSLRR